MTLSIPPPIGTGFTSSPTAPDYQELNSKELTQTITTTNIKQGSAPQGAILHDGSDILPLESLSPIRQEEAQAGRPSLLPLFRIRFVENQKIEGNNQQFYEQLHDALPPAIQAKLDEVQTKIRQGDPLEEGDEFFIALEQSLRFDAKLLALSLQSTKPILEGDPALVAAERYENLSHTVKQETVKHGEIIQQNLTQYLNEIGTNDPAYDLFSHASNQLKEVLNLLR